MTSHVKPNIKAKLFHDDFHKLLFLCLILGTYIRWLLLKHCTNVRKTSLFKIDFKFPETDPITHISLHQRTFICVTILYKCQDLIAHFWGVKNVADFPELNIHKMNSSCQVIYCLSLTRCLSSCKPHIPT